MKLVDLKEQHRMEAPKTDVDRQVWPTRGVIPDTTISLSPTRKHFGYTVYTSQSPYVLAQFIEKVKGREKLLKQAGNRSNLSGSCEPFSKKLLNEEWLEALQLAKKHILD